MLLATQSAANAQTPPRWKVQNITVLGFAPNVDQNGTMGINAKNQVVYGYIINGEMHAWIWLPAPDYNLAAGFHDIKVLTSSSSQSIAHDINYSGKAVGQLRIGGRPQSQLGQAVAWTFAPTGGVTTTHLGYLQANDPWSDAHAINDQQPPLIVGSAGHQWSCLCPQFGDPDPLMNDVIHGFYVPLTVPIVPLTFLRGTPDSQSSARDVLTPLGGNPPWIAGYTYCLSALCAAPLPPCAEDKDAILWRTQPIVAIHPMPDLGLYSSETRAVNNYEQAAGWGYTADGQCDKRALYWSGPGAAPTNLGTFMPPNHSGQQSHAEAINLGTPITVAGWNEDTQEAYIWEKQPPGGPEWKVTDLNAAKIIGNCPHWTIFQAHDVSNDGWIAVVATRNDGSGPVFRAFVLIPHTPNPCPADIVIDNEVDVDDLLAVINGWGPCPSFAECPPDTNYDCVVNVDDLLNVINGWGEPACSGLPGQAIPRTVQDCMNLYFPEDPESLQKCLHAIEELNNAQP